MPRHLKRAIDRLMKELIGLSAKVEDNVRLSVRSLEEMDMKLAKDVIETDREIDQKEIDIEEECLKILALHQPVAIDLRYIVAVLKINNDLERIGDLALNISRHAIHLINNKKLLKKFNFGQMEKEVLQMLKKSLDSVVNLNAVTAHEVLKNDDVVDQIKHDKIKEVIKEMKKNPEDTDILIHYVHIARHLERIADHTTNIAEDLIYLIEGDIVRHSKAKE